MNGSTIEVRATGPYARDAHPLYTIYLRGPDDRTRRRATGRFDTAGVCTFSDLPSGRYWLTTDTKADVGYRVMPRQAEVQLESGTPGRARVELVFGTAAPIVRDHRKVR